MPPRKVSDVPADVAAALSRGERETRDLVEAFTVDFAQLFRAALPDAPTDAVERVRAGASLSYVKRMRLAAQAAHDAIDGPASTAESQAFDVLSRHPSDTARGWAAFIAGLGERPLADRLAMVRPLADDPHFGVREWAWLGVRDAIVAEPREAVELLGPWVLDERENIRRFATEATRPRGVWARHITVLKESPEIALPLLESVHADASGYVRDSVGNWLNDAAKTKPEWVRTICDRWTASADQEGSNTLHAVRHVVKRATRSL